MIKQLRCLLGHQWSMYAGYYEERVHAKAYCLRCGKVFKEL